MALTTRHESHLGFDLPERWRRWFDLDWDAGRWLRVEEFQKDGSLVIRAELPGIDPAKDVEVEVSDGVLHIAARREERKQETEKKAVRSEFRYGEFSRDVALPPGVDTSAITAGYKDGILEIVVPWPKESRSSITKVPVAKT